MMRRSALLMGLLMGLSVFLVAMPAYAQVFTRTTDKGHVVNGNFAEQNGTDAVDWSANGSVSVTGNTYTGTWYSTNNDAFGGGGDGRIAVLSTNGATAITDANHYQFWGSESAGAPPALLTPILDGYTTASSITQELHDVYGTMATDHISGDRPMYLDFYMNLVVNSRSAVTDPTLNAMPYVSFKLRSDSTLTSGGLQGSSEAPGVPYYPDYYAQILGFPDAQHLVFGDNVSTGWQEVSIRLPGINEVTDPSWGFWWGQEHLVGGFFQPADVDFTIGLLGNQYGGGGNFDLLVSNVHYSDNPGGYWPSTGAMSSQEDPSLYVPFPEPSSAMLLLGLAISGLAAMRRRATA